MPHGYLTSLAHDPQKDPINSFIPARPGRELPNIVLLFTLPALKTKPNPWLTTRVPVPEANTLRAGRAAWQAGRRVHLPSLRARFRFCLHASGEACKTIDMHDNPSLATGVEGFRFDDRFFERGLIWQECLESWPADRERFLRGAHGEPLLAKTAECLPRFPLYTRFAIYHGTWNLDSFLSLPAIGFTFSCAGGIETRFFCREYFFPVLGSVLGRKTPRILLLGEEGQIVKSWGPRPDSLTRQLAKQHEGPGMDLWLRGLDAKIYHRELDRDLHRFLCQ